MPHQGFRATYAELWQQVDRAARALLARGVRKGDRVGIWAPNRYEWVVTQFATARVGAILVTINPAYKAAELALRAAQGRREPARHGARLPRTDYVGMLEQVRPACATRSCSRTTGTRSWPRATRRRRRAARRARGGPATRRRDQHPVHVGHHGRAQGRDAHAPQHPQQRVLHGAHAAATPSTTACACPCRSTTPSAWCSARLACATHGACMVLPGESFDAARGAGGGRGRALHVALRRADDVHRRARRAGLRAATTCRACAPG